MARTETPAQQLSRGELTRERIMAAAHECIRRWGIRRTSMEAVAEEAKVSRAALYRYFSNKQVLVDAVLDRNAGRFRVELTRVLARQKTLAGKVGAAARFGQAPPRDLYLLGLGETDPESLALLITTGAHAFLERATRFWEPHVAEAQRRGEISADLVTRQAAEWIARSLFNLSTTPVVTLDRADPSAVARFASTYIVGGLVGGHPRRSLSTTLR